MPSVVYQTARPATPPENTTVAVTSTALGVAQNVVSVNDLKNFEFDYYKVTSYDANDNPLVIEYRLGGPAGTLKATITYTWDISGRFESAYRT